MIIEPRYTVEAVHKIIYPLHMSKIKPENGESLIRRTDILAEIFVRFIRTSISIL
jgi:hypothetical protein